MATVLRVVSRDDQAALELAPQNADFFSAELRSRGMSATARVGSYLTTDFAEFFALLARGWRGWQGTREWQSLEGELALSAEADRTGHVYLAVTLQDGAPARWVVRTHLVLEGGQLDALAAQASAFEQAIVGRAG